MQMPVVSAFYLKEIDKARREIRALIYNKQCAHLMLRLAWNDAGTYDDFMKTGGPNGSIRNPDVYSRDSNKGLKVAIDYCGDIKSRHPEISYADLYQLAGVVAVEITGGPTIDFVPGRKDSTVSPEEDQLPSPKEGIWHLRDKFYRMKLYDRAIVALLGAHNLAHADRSGFDGSGTKEPLKFDNSYFVDLFRKESAGLIKHPTDLALLEDRWFRDFADMYAKNKGLFFKDYAEAHKQLSELGFTRRTYLPCETDHISCAIGVAIVVVTFGYMYKFWKK